METHAYVADGLFIDLAVNRKQLFVFKYKSIESYRIRIYTPMKSMETLDQTQEALSGCIWG